MAYVPSPIKCRELSDDSDWSVLVWHTVRSRERGGSPSAVKPWKDWRVAARSGWDPLLAGLGKVHAARAICGPSAAGTGEGCEKFLKRDRCAVVEGGLSLMNKDALELKSNTVVKGYRSMRLASRHLLWDLLTMGWFWIRGGNNFAVELFQEWMLTQTRRRSSLKWGCSFCNRRSPQTHCCVRFSSVIFIEDVINI